jgi:3-deoxy-D-manno-octulosonate 8-phosphate phosphatase (KDO 8-P phosphatase)
LSGDDLLARCGRIQLIAMDVDGTLTDGLIILDSQGGETKHFHVRDGMGIALAHQAGMTTALITARQSAVVERRAAELNIRFVLQGVKNKADALQRMIAELQLQPEQVAYIGDDVNDLEVSQMAGVSFAVQDAAPLLKEAVDVVLSLPGGRGAVREAIELLLQAKQKQASPN